MDRGGPVLKKIMRTRPLCCREIIYLASRSSARYFPARREFSTRQNQHENVIYIARRAKRGFPPTFFRNRS